MTTIHFIPHLQRATRKRKKSFSKFRFSALFTEWINAFFCNKETLSLSLSFFFVILLSTLCRGLILWFCLIYELPSELFTLQGIALPSRVSASSDIKTERGSPTFQVNSLNVICCYTTFIHHIHTSNTYTTYTTYIHHQTHTPHTYITYKHKIHTNTCLHTYTYTTYIHTYIHTHTYTT